VANDDAWKLLRSLPGFGFSFSWREVQRRLESSLCAKLYSEKRGDALEKIYKRFVVTFIRTKKK